MKNFTTDASPILASEFKLMWTKNKTELGQEDNACAQVGELFIHHLTTKKRKLHLVYFDGSLLIDLIMRALLCS